jgi:hypothetical protein
MDKDDLMLTKPKALLVSDNRCVNTWNSSQSVAFHPSRCRWVDNIKMDLRKIGWVHMDWTDLAQNRE